MRILIAVCMQYATDSMNVNWRNVFEIKEALEQRKHNVEYVSIIAQSDGSKHKSMMEKKLNQAMSIKWDHILVVYSSWYVHLDAAKKIRENNPQAKVGFFTTDYEINRHEAFNPYHYVISNFVEDYYDGKKKFYDSYLFTNANSLIYEGRNKPVQKKYDCIYYGRYRGDRVNSFKKYFNKKMHISTTAKNVNKFKLQCGFDVKFIDAISWVKGKETLNLYKSFLYIEDETTHKYFNNLANRFYEGLTCNSFPFVDIDCSETFRKSGYPLADWMIVNSKESLEQAIEDMKIKDYINEPIFDLWDELARAEKKKTLNEICSFMEGV